MSNIYLDLSNYKNTLQLESEDHLAESAVSLTNKQKLSLYKKSQKSGYSTDILEEVYRRGHMIWKPELFEGTREQFAFDRVNSFISGGFALDLDSDLMEAHYSQTRPSQGFEYKGKVIGAIWKNDEGQYVSKRRKNPDKKSGPAFIMKHKTREDAEKHLISKSGLDEQYFEEKEVWDKPNPVKKHKTLSPQKKAAAKARAKAAGRPYPNMIDNMWAARNEEVTPKMSPEEIEADTAASAKPSTNNDPKKLIKNLAIKMAARKVGSMALGGPVGGVVGGVVGDMLTREEYTGSEKVSKNKNDPSSRFDGTTSVAKIYAKDTPYQGVPPKSIKKKIKVIKEAVEDFQLCEDCDCGLYEELLNERGKDSKGYFRSTESGAGLTAKGAKHFGVKTAVTEKDPGPKRAARRRSFCARMSGMKGPMKDEKGRPTRKAMSLRRWRCRT